MRKQGILDFRYGGAVLLLTTCLLSSLAQPATAQLSGLLDRATGPKDFGEQAELLTALLISDPDSEQQAIEQEAVAVGIRQGPEVDQQKGATADAAGTTNLTEKPGVAELLNLAIENGAISKTISGTSFTLQTTPYMLYSRFGSQDTAATWDNLTVLRRIAISATFDQGTSGAEATRNNFQSGKIKYAWGELSPRDKKFRQRMQPIIRDGLDAFSAKANGELADFAHKHSTAFADGLIKLTNWMAAQHKPIDRQALIEEAKKDSAPIRSQLTPEDFKSLKQLADSLAAEEKAIIATSDRVAEAAKAYLNEPHSQFSLSYTLQRDPASPDTSNTDLSAINLVVAYNTGANLTFNLNADVQLNNNLTAIDGTRLDRVRSYSAAGDLTLGKFAKDTADFSVAAKVTRPQGEAHQMASAQAKLNLYLARGVTIPLALTYSNRTEDSPRSAVRFNVGLAMKADTFMGVAKSNP